MECRSASGPSPWGDLPRVRSDGFNLVHTYDVEGGTTSPDYIESAARSGLGVMAQIGGGTLAIPTIATVEQIPSALTPEECGLVVSTGGRAPRWNEPLEMGCAGPDQAAGDGQRPAERPIYNSQPANRLPQEVAAFGPYAGVYGMGLYTNDYFMPRQGVRWVMQNTVAQRAPY
jgi:hypothetical protein